MPFPDHAPICAYFLTEDKFSLVTGELYVSRCVTCEQARNEGAKCGRLNPYHFSEIKIVKEIEFDPIEISVKSVVNAKEKPGKKDKDKTATQEDSSGSLTTTEDPK